MRLFEALDPASGAYVDGELIDSLVTPYQTIEVHATAALGRLLRIDGCNMTSERDEFFYHENLIHPAATVHPAPQDVLIIGGGDGGAAEEMLKHPQVRRLTIAELDGGVIAMARKHFQGVHRGAFDDARVDIRLGDGREVVRAADARWDLIYLDLTDPSGPAQALYAADFFATCRRALKPGGALVSHIGSPFSHAGRVKHSVEVLGSIFAVVAPYFVHVPAYGATWGFAVSSDTLDPRCVPAIKVQAQLQARGIGLRQFYNGDMHAALFALPEYVRELLQR